MFSRIGLALVLCTVANILLVCADDNVQIGEPTLSIDTSTVKLDEDIANEAVLFHITLQPSTYSDEFSTTQINAVISEVIAGSATTQQDRTPFYMDCFAYNACNLMLKANPLLDYETTPAYEIVIFARERRTSRRTGHFRENQSNSYRLYVIVEDVREPALFKRNQYFNDPVYEAVEQGTSAGIGFEGECITDEEAKGFRKEETYNIRLDSCEKGLHQYFYINPNNYQLQFARTYDMDDTNLNLPGSIVDCTVSCRLMNDPLNRVDYTSLTLTIYDKNDNSPQFSSVNSAYQEFFDIIDDSSFKIVLHSRNPWQEYPVKGLLVKDKDFDHETNGNLSELALLNVDTIRAASYFEVVRPSTDSNARSLDNNSNKTFSYDIRVSRYIDWPAGNVGVVKVRAVDAAVSLNDRLTSSYTITFSLDENVGPPEEQGANNYWYYSTTTDSVAWTTWPVPVYTDSTTVNWALASRQTTEWIWGGPNDNINNRRPSFGTGTGSASDASESKSDSVCDSEGDCKDWFVALMCIVAFVFALIVFGILYWCCKKGCKPSPTSSRYYEDIRWRGESRSQRTNYRNEAVKSMQRPNKVYPNTSPRNQRVPRGIEYEGRNEAPRMAPLGYAQGY